MTDAEVKQRIIAVLTEGEKTVDEIKDVLWIAKRNVEHALRSLRREGRVAHYEGKYRIVSDVVITKETKTKKKITKVHYPSWIITVLKVFFSVVAICATITSIRNTSNYLLESYPIIFAYMISISIALFIVAGFSVIPILFKKGSWLIGSAVTLLWVIVVIYSMSATTIGMYNKSKDMFKEATVTNQVIQADTVTYKNTEKQEGDIRKNITNKQTSLDRYNTDIGKFEYGSDEYKVLEKKISDAESYINTQTAVLNGLMAKKTTLKDSNKAVVISKNFYEMIEENFHIHASIVQFVLSLLASIFLDIIAPIGVHMALFLKEGK